MVLGDFKHSVAAKFLISAANSFLYFFFYLSLQSRRRTCAPDRRVEAVPEAAKVNPLYGVQAWRSWVLGRNKDPTDSECDVVRHCLEFSYLK